MLLPSLLRETSHLWVSLDWLVSASTLESADFFLYTRYQKTSPGKCRFLRPIPAGSTYVNVCILRTSQCCACSSFLTGLISGSCSSVQSRFFHSCRRRQPACLVKNRDVTLPGRLPLPESRHSCSPFRLLFVFFSFFQTVQQVCVIYQKNVPRFEPIPRIGIFEKNYRPWQRIHQYYLENTLRTS